MAATNRLRNLRAAASAALLIPIAVMPQFSGAYASKHLIRNHIRSSARYCLGTCLGRFRIRISIIGVCRCPPPSDIPINAQDFSLSSMAHVPLSDCPRERFDLRNASTAICRCFLFLNMTYVRQSNMVCCIHILTLRRT